MPFETGGIFYSHILHTKNRTRPWEEQHDSINQQLNGLTFLIRGTFYIDGSKDAPMARSSMTRSKLVDIWGPRLCGDMFLAELRKKHQEAGSASALTLDAVTQLIEIPPSLPPKPRITRRLSATRASWLFVSQAGKLTEKQKQHIGQIRAGHPDLERAYQLGQDFVMMLAERREADLDTWLTQAAHSGLPEFKKMANGIRLDSAAVKAAESSMWSQGKARSSGQLLKAPETDRVREGEL